MLFQLIQHSSNGFYIFSLLTFSIDENVIGVYKNKNNKFVSQDYVNIILKCGWGTGQAKKYYLVLKVAIIGPEGRFLFIAFPNPYLMVEIG